jgi:16S rRNA (uracil1498-N3)-methyltransferase
MRIPRIHTQQALHCGDTLELEPGAARHVARVLRMSAGDALVLFNGEGGEYPSQLGNVDRKRVTARVLERREGVGESPLAIHLGIAISRGERMDWVVQKATELGVSSLSPVFTERTEVKLGGDRADKKLHHWHQVAISACEQCGRNRLPAISPPTGLQSWLETTSAECRYVLNHGASDSRSADAAPASIALLSGPEGGLSAAEIEIAEQAGYRQLALGPRVMRTETAPLAAIAILQAHWGDMRLT